jgi:hypothetical protein
MADAWNPATSYSPGAIVTYNGQTYYRSQYPATGTGGTPPNQEMNVDSEGDLIRTWTIFVGGYSGYQPKFATVYFRIIEPPLSSETGLPDFGYAGGQFGAGNAYAPIENGIGYVFGSTIEMDQAKNNPSPTPDSPVCPAEFCGVAMQQWGENGFVACGVDSTPHPTIPRKYYIYVLFNHPLYFRRTITVVTQIKKTVTVFDPFEETVTYENTYTPYGPDDRNYISFSTIQYGSYLVPANAAFEIVVPPDETTSTGSTTYQFSARGFQEATPND